MFQRINKALLPMKGHYFLFNAGTAPVIPFMSTYARQLGFSSFVVGVVYTIIPVCGMVAKPVMGAIADRFKCQKYIFLISLLITAASFIALFYTPKLPVLEKIKFSCDSSQVVLDTCMGNSLVSVSECTADELGRQTSSVSCQLTCPMESSYWNTICNWGLPEYCSNTDTSLTFTAYLDLQQLTLDKSCLQFPVTNATVGSSTVSPSCPSTQDSISTICDVKCDSYVVNELLEQPEVSDDEVYGVYQYWVFLFFMIIYWVSQAVSVSVSDAICFELLGDRPEKYGQQRLYGALGWGIFSSITGFIIDAHSAGQSSKNFIIAFYMGAAILLVDFLVSLKIQYTQSRRSPNILKDVGRLLLNIRILIFMLWCICVGMCTGLIWQFLFWLVEDLAADLGCDTFAWVKTLEGIIMGVQCLLGEFPFFFLSGYILKRIGYTNAMTLVLIVIGIRYIIYSVIKNPWYFLPFEVLNGLTYGLFYACMASYASIVAPSGTETTVQGLVGAVFEGVGVSLGSLLGGYLYNIYGGPMTYRIFGIGALVAGLLHLGAQALLFFFGTEKDDLLKGYATPKEAVKKTYGEQRELKLVI